jgi:formamidopyrimidine-DNA glycosylase
MSLVPELPDITAYLTALARRVLNQPLEHLRIASPLLLRTAIPPITSIEGQPVRALRRIGKRIVFCFDDDLFLVLHLMIAGRLHWRDLDPKSPAPPSTAATTSPPSTSPTALSPSPKLVPSAEHLCTSSAVNLH